MRLKKIKLAGFKSFVDPTSIPFPDDMTAIVGPNGCGKSNVIDAVRWVLGESSARNLRGDAMTDVIFNGSSARKPVSQSSVELVFDNTSGRIQGEFAGYNELSVKRLVTREAQSFYYLNGTKCRRRDITDLFLGTGLGPRSYAIIEQGMISRLIESKPQELRVFIEEAAGISKYKERRRETENRIRHTRENLERLEDVRAELGQQLEKLQRQASAAKRYSELKQKERHYKGELAAIRWLKHNQIISELDLRTQQQETAIEAFISQQRGDERGITEYRQKQADLKQNLTDVQEQYFRLGTDITRIEQNQIHSRQRKQQIEQELEELKSTIDESTTHLEQEMAHLEELEERLTLGEPETELLEQQLEQVQYNLSDAEEQLSKQNLNWRQQDESFAQLKQQVQSRHGQVQSTMNMQMRTQQRISEIKLEMRDVSEQVNEQILSQLAEEIKQAEGLADECQEQAMVANENWQQYQSKMRELQEQKLSQQGEIQQVEAQITSLSLLLEQQKHTLENWLEQQNLPYQTLWQYLDVKPGWEHAVETVCHGWRSFLVIRDPISLTPEQGGGGVLFSSAMSHEKPVGSLAEKLTNQQVPYWLTTIQAAENDSEPLNGYGSVVYQSGLWKGQDWSCFLASQQGESQLERIRQLQLAEEKLVTLQQTFTQTEEQLRSQSQLSEPLQQQLKTCEEQARNADNQFQLKRNQRVLLQQQLEQVAQRKQKLANELEQHQRQLQDESEQLEELAAELEELEMSLEQQQDAQTDNEGKRTELEEKVQYCKEQFTTVSNNSHTLALDMQGVRSRYQSLKANHGRYQQQQTLQLEKQTQLKKEFETLEQPIDEQSKILSALLEQRMAIELKQTEVTEALTEVDNWLADAEKGQQGVTDRIEKMRSELENTRVESEGFKVRAKGVLEQLEDMGQPLKPILDTLPEEHNEQVWQQELDKTVNAVSRLGAVNLAAVEEYEVQSERKQHLDTQNDDLSSALDTLENAIRKIDRETRSRFKETFDRVNDDLKMLFPKVFGGGSAYLDLPDDDLLETGVTIMARPPGKKNSTIHLLSGGEKALTALSLVFAIFRLNPAPFCLLDEVDAPLDDANVGRFCKLVSEMSKTVQFIYITHNKIAMEMATHLTGVTMAEPGVSRMVAVDVDEAINLVET